jgi:phosphatidylethanolamine-binding protein (PEBP) family uncharacterized protein
LEHAGIVAAKAVPTCPPEGPPHKYRFTLYALDMPSIDDAGTPMTWRKLRFIIKGHVLGQASLTGLRGHG